MNERNLWTAVVMQAAADLDGFSKMSLLYAQAKAFFFDSGPWAVSRQAVADQIGLHPDDLTRLGQRILAARERRHERERRLFQPSELIGYEQRAAQDG